MKHLMRYVRQLNQRRMTAFHLLPQSNDEKQAVLHGQLRLESFAPIADRPRSLREMFADTEYENENDDDQP
ncbi:hypothetical protein L1889_10540 [Paenalcaligenes niemegkensis]|uniref:hypothetical protein n=1 Tax=Paenalcaligenes niemegkensis TaxID=2895469 RepID=UPI001EE79D60|nr:hypothetical protein [Paenalcaligenes niemegkensis]MCQ9617088.1 hypothetical protein [Paenalcaligenes niemegkensis]